MAMSEYDSYKSWLHFFAEPAFVGIVFAHGHVAFGAVEKVADGVVRAGIGPSLRPGGRGFLGCARRSRRSQAGVGNAFASESLGADKRFVICDPVADLELEHLA